MSQKKARTTREKGDLVERVVAKMFSGPGIKVETKVWLPPFLAPVGRKIARRDLREIDVLITAPAPGKPVRIAVECKNEKEKIGAEHIDAFVGKLDYLGIPAQYGIYVTSGSYTEGAQAMAARHRVMVLTLEGLTEDRFDSEKHPAVQIVVNLLCGVETFAINSRSEDSPPIFDEATGEFRWGNQHPMAFFDKDEKYRGSLLDLLWRKWRDGEVPATLGRHEVEIDVPDGWFQFFEHAGMQVPDLNIKTNFVYNVTGHVISIKGEVTKHTLKSGLDDDQEKWQKKHFDAQFPEIGLSERGTLIVNDLSAVRVEAVKTEEQLSKISAEQKAGGAVWVETRFPMPRLLISTKWGPMFWPPSEIAMKKIAAFAMEFRRTGQMTPENIGDDPFEEKEIGAVWAPIFSGYPVD